MLGNCRRILAENPNDNGAEQLFARALLQKGRLSEATAIFEKQDQAGTGSPGFLFGYCCTRWPAAGAEAEKVDRAKLPGVALGSCFRLCRGLCRRQRTVALACALREEAGCAIHDPRVGIWSI